MILTKFENTLLLEIWWNLDFTMDPVSSTSKSWQKTFLPVATLTPNNKCFLFGDHFFRWKSDISTGDNLQIIGKVQKFLKKSTCLRKLENLKLQHKVQSDQLFTWKGSRDTRIDRHWLILVALPLRHSLLVIWRIKAKHLRL